MTVETEKLPSRENILCALSGFIRQRAGLQSCSYGDVSAYRSEQRSITRDRHHAEALLSAVSWRTDIDAAALVAASRSAYSGRLTIKLRNEDAAVIEYCAGQYFPTEYRAAACAVLASALWAHFQRNTPAPDAWRVESWWSGIAWTHDYGKPHATREAAEAELASLGGQKYGHVAELIRGQSVGTYLRATARQEFGKAIADKWFN